MDDVKSYVKLVFQLGIVGVLIGGPVSVAIYASWVAIGLGRPDFWQTIGSCYAVYSAIMLGRWTFAVTARLGD